MLSGIAQRVCAGGEVIEHRPHTVGMGLDIRCAECGKDTAEQSQQFCRKVRSLGQNLKIVYQELNGLQTPKISKKQFCDRTL